MALVFRELVCLSMVSPKECMGYTNVVIGLSVTWAHYTH
ncbi:hypothetical protein GPLA_0359 [Paraglaciecola polaris LMG 21857]|uniref:Uncharacterized protein n=1 Tax=Paraglaciecola polaris LMG 21857 TaxID=1129793 RepID=K6ZQZ1_9ALTE|nr:hypothetical protein GPLA_0359 [Paraglaciecola polaris LMG 21857]